MKIIQLKDNIEFLDQAAHLFNEYRKFYKQDSNLDKAKEFLLDRLKNNESEIFLALVDEKKVVGFMQLYHGFSSVGLKKILILNDLYIDQDHRKSGVGRVLMGEARKFALKNNITKLTLTTAKDNLKAQGLYESEGYKKDEDYFVYNLSC